MMKNLKTILAVNLIIALALFITAAVPTGETPSENKVQRVSLEYLENIMAADNDTLYILNFWATWCKPCIEELPYFEKINRKYADKKVKVILVSVDYPKHYESRLLPFVEKQALQSQVVLLDVNDPNDWIPAINKDWKGSIPATLMVCPNDDTNRFYEREFNYKELKEIVDAQI